MAGIPALSDPNNYTRGDINYSGLKFAQTVVLGDVYAKVTYQITNGSVPASSGPQEIPAIHTAQGMSKSSILRIAHGVYLTFQ